MPRYFTPDGHSYYSDNPLDPKDIDNLIGVTAQSGMQTPPKINPDITRRDTQMFNINPTELNNWISDKASKLPRALQWPVAAGATALTNIPLDLIQSVLGAPEGLALGLLSAKGARFGTANKYEPISSIAPEAPKSSITVPPELNTTTQIANSPSSLQVPEPKIGTPPYNTSQFGFGLAKPESNPLLSHVPNRLRPPSTNATVFDALLPERLKLNEQGAALPPTTAIVRGEHVSIPQEVTPVPDAPVLSESVKSPVESENIPTPGNARVTAESIALRANESDISTAAAYGGSTDQVLESREITKPIVDLVRNQGWDKMQSTIGSEIRQLGEITDGLDSDQLQRLGRVAEGQEIDISDIANFDQRLTNYRALMDGIFNEAKVAREGKLGYIEDYVTHTQKLPEDEQSALKSIFNFQQGKNAWNALFEKRSLEQTPSGEAGGIYNTGATGAIGESPYTKTRTSEDSVNYDLNKLGRMYIESMSRERYLRPAIQRATELVKGLPEDTKLKELAEAYIRNVTRFDSAPQLHQAMQKFTRFVIDTTSRSMLGFNPHLQALHAMRLGPVFAELGPEYSAKGLGVVVKNPVAAYQEVASLGLMPNELMPMKFQNRTEKLASIMNFKSVIDMVDRATAYNGFKQKYLDTGMDAASAVKQALVDTKRVTFQTDPSRQNVMLMGNQQNPVAQLATQFKQVPAKIAEWIVRTGQQYKENPAIATRTATLLGGTQALRMAGGPNLFHLPGSLTDLSAASFNEMRKVMTYVVKGDLDKAAEEIALWATPAGLSTRRLLQ